MFQCAVRGKKMKFRCLVWSSASATAASRDVWENEEVMQRSAQKERAKESKTTTEACCLV